MIILGIILALIGYLLNVPILGPLGIILIVVGAVLWFVPVGRVGGPNRRIW